MIFIVVPLLVGGAVALAAPRLARRMSPAAAAALLTGLALSVSVTVGAMLCLAAVIGLKLTLPALRPADWSTAVFRDVVPLPPAAGIVAGAVAAVLLGCAAAHVVSVGLHLRRAAVAARHLSIAGGLAVLEDDRALAYAVPGRPGRVVVSTGLLRTMTGAQRRAVIEHERSHLRHRHHLYAQLVRLAACANPLLWPVVRAVDVALERWADADAAREVGDPRIVAHALGAVALSSPAAPGVALGMARHAVVERVAFLLEPPVRRARGIVPALATVAVWVATVWAALHVYGLIEAAEAAYVRR